MKTCDYFWFNSGVMRMVAGGWSCRETDDSALAPNGCLIEVKPTTVRRGRLRASFLLRWRILIQTPARWLYVVCWLVCAAELEIENEPSQLPVGYDLCVIIPISRLLTVFKHLFSIVSECLNRSLIPGTVKLQSLVASSTGWCVLGSRSDPVISGNACMWTFYLGQSSFMLTVDNVELRIKPPPKHSQPRCRHR